jgi:hypothetical protein
MILFGLFAAMLFTIKFSALVFSFFPNNRTKLNFILFINYVYIKGNANDREL